ncbi:hypothetical protein DXG01_013071 [Tephrocybe rancida]|nr:hypothetical protein DXG01_013071 [Tephrocybe rancida]
MNPIPFDVIDLILDLLMQENTSVSLQAVRSCALVASALTPHVQRRLFATITLTAETDNASFESILASHTQLASHVQIMSICISRLTPEDATRIASVLCMLSHLQSLELESIDPQESFLGIPYAFQIAILGCFQKVVSLQCFWLRDLPIRFIVSCTQLKRLSIWTFLDAGQIDAQVNAGLIKRTTCQLDHLTVDHLSCLPPLIDTQHSLVTLNVCNISFRDVLPLIRGSQQSLTHLYLRSSNFNLDVNYVGFGLDFPSLQSLTFEETNTCCDPILTILNGALTILECGPATPLRELKFVGIEFLMLDLHDVLLLKETWKRLDKVLTHARYQGLITLMLGMTLGGVLASDTLGDVVRDSILQSLPMLASASEVVLRLRLDIT